MAASRKGRMAYNGPYTQKTPELAGGGGLPLHGLFAGDFEPFRCEAIVGKGIKEGTSDARDEQRGIRQVWETGPTIDRIEVGNSPLT
jgi:hypothetical protein